MNLTEIGEFGLIGQIQKRFSVPYRRQAEEAVVLGIGDDAAVWRPSADRDILLTTDTLMEGSHFKREWSSFHQIGYKAVSVNVSDIAAMGGRPRAFLVSLGLPDDISVGDVGQLYRGIARGCRVFDIVLIGGNVTATQGPFFVAVTLMGEVARGRLVRRNGAAVGDALYVTGCLGEAAAGLALLEREYPRRSGSRLLRRYRAPEARWREGRLLGDMAIPSAMIDLSDGLAADLGHLTAQSGVGATLLHDAIPVSSALRRFAKRVGVDPARYALYGGEDYELLFSVSGKSVQKLEKLIRDGLIQACRIGTITPKGEGLVMVGADGCPRRLRPSGYDHLNRGADGTGKDI